MYGNEPNEKEDSWGICEDGVDGWMIETRELWFDAPNGSKVPVLEQRLRLFDERWGKTGAATHLVTKFDEQFPDGSGQGDGLILVDFGVAFSPTDNGQYLDPSINWTMEYEKEKNQEICQYRPLDGDLIVRYNFDKATPYFDDTDQEHAKKPNVIDKSGLFRRGHWVECYYYFMNETGPVASAWGVFISSGWTSTVNLVVLENSESLSTGPHDGSLSK